MSTRHHAKYYANEIVKHQISNDVESLSSSLFDSCVDLNPHQIEKAFNKLQEEFELTKKRRKIPNRLDDIEDKIEDNVRHMKDQLHARLQHKVKLQQNGEIS